MVNLNLVSFLQPEFLDGPYMFCPLNSISRDPTLSAACFWRKLRSASMNGRPSRIGSWSSKDKENQSKLVFKCLQFKSRHVQTFLAFVTHRKICRSTHGSRMLKVQIVLQIFVHRMEDEQGSSRIDVRLDQSSLKTVWRLFEDSLKTLVLPLGLLYVSRPHWLTALQRPRALWQSSLVPLCHPHGLPSMASLHPRIPCNVL